MIYKQFVAFNYDSCSIAPLTDQVHNKIFQEFLSESDYFYSFDGRVYIDVRDSKGYTGELEKLRRDDSNLILHLYLKAATIKNMRLQVFSHSQGEHLYILPDNDLTIKYKICSIARKKRHF